MIAMMFSLLLIGLLVQSIASAMLKSIATSCDMDITPQKNPAELRRKQRRRKQRRRKQRKHTKQQPEKIIWSIKLEIEEMYRRGKSLFSLLSNRYSGQIDDYFIPWFYRLNINCDLDNMYRSTNNPTPMPEGYVCLVFDDLCIVVAVTPEYFNNHEYLRNISSSAWKDSGSYFPAIGIGEMRYPTICILNSDGFLPKSDSQETLYMMLQKKLLTRFTHNHF
jgi:Ni/Co efflux regulator RcnB